MERRIFLGLLLFLLVGSITWYIFSYQEQLLETQQAETKLQQILTKVRSARLAQSNMKTIEGQFKNQQINLEKERTRFMNKSDISNVTEKLKKFAVEYKVKLMDFAPRFEEYFTENPNMKIIDLPLEITVHGRYADIGRFIENFNQLPFYLIADELTIERVEEESNELKAQIITKLYTWNK